MTLCVLYADWKRWRGPKNRCAGMWRHFLVKPSKQRFKNSSATGSITRTGRGSRSITRHNSLTGVPGILKRGFDVIGAGSALLLLAPLFAIVAIAIRMSDGGSI